MTSSWHLLRLCKSRTGTAIFVDIMTQPVRAPLSIQGKYGALSVNDAEDDDASRRSWRRSSLIMGAAAAVGTLLLMTVALATSVRRQRVGGGAGDEGGATVVGGSVVECTRVARLFETKLSDWSEKSVGMREISRASRAASGAAGISGPCALSFVPAGSPAYYGPGGQVSVEGRGVVQLNASAHYQKITGFGGAFTDAAGLVWQTLPHTVRERVVELYFGVTGIGYTLGRVHINSCDFSVDSYTYDSVDYDYELASFDMNVTQAEANTLPLVRAAIAATAAAASARGLDPTAARLKLFASPWSPPAWMKSPILQDDTAELEISMTGSADPNGLRDDARTKAAWALYFSKFIDAYKGRGVEMWGVTVQNEPEFAAPWEACKYNASFQANFVRDFLGPRLHADHPGVKLLAFDHNKDHVLEWARELYSDPATARYIDGIAFHWYAGGMNRLLDGAMPGANLHRAHRLAPRKMLLPSEGCNCPSVALGDNPNGRTMRAQRYAHDVLDDLNAYAVGWTDWNLLLDHTGGPNHLGNVCDAPIVVNEAGDDVIVQPYYYVLGHYAKFLPPGSQRIGVFDAGIGYYPPAPNGGPRPSYVQPGFSAALWHCEGSARQVWSLTERGQLALNDLIASDGERDTNVDQETEPLCLSKAADPGLGGLTLVPCSGVNASLWLTLDETYTGLELSQPSSGKCLVAADGGVYDGAQLQLGECGEPAAKWQLNAQGELRTAVDGRCVTAGWPFFQATAFRTPAAETVVIALNEGDDDVAFTIDENGQQLATTIPAHAIQTYVF